MFINGAQISQQFTAAYWQAQGCWDRSSTVANHARLDAATGRASGEVTLGAGQYFLMGDNRTASGSEDSRLFGPVPQRDIAGRAAAVVWPVLRRRAATYDCQAAARPQDHVTYSGPSALNLRWLGRPAAFGASRAPTLRRCPDGSDIRPSGQPARSRAQSVVPRKREPEQRTGFVGWGHAGGTF